MTTTNTKSNVASSTRCDQYLHLLHQTNLVQKSPMYIPLQLVNSSRYQQIQTRYSHLTHHYCRTLMQIQQHYRDNPTSNLYSTSIIDASNGIVPNISVLVHSTQRPNSTPNIQDCFDAVNPFCSFWIQTIYEQFDKNMSCRVFTSPIKKSSISPNTMVLRSVLIPSVEPTDIPHLWKLNIRHGVNGTPTNGMIEYGKTRTSTFHPDTARFQLAFCASQGF